MGFTSAARIWTRQARLRGPAHRSMAWPVVSSVCQAWLWKARKTPTQRDAAGRWRTSPPSCHTPSSPWNEPLLPWFMWMSCTPLPGRKPNTLSCDVGLGSPALPERVQAGAARRRWRARCSGPADRRGRCRGPRRREAAAASAPDRRGSRGCSRGSDRRAPGRAVPARSRAPSRSARDRVRKVVVDQVEQLRRRLLGQHVHRDAVVGAVVVDHVHLVVGAVAGALAPAGESSPA